MTGGPAAVPKSVASSPPIIVSNLLVYLDPFSHILFFFFREQGWLDQSETFFIFQSLITRPISRIWFLAKHQWFFYIFLKKLHYLGNRRLFHWIFQKFLTYWCKLLFNLMPSFYFRKKGDPKKPRVLASLSRVFGVKNIPVRDTARPISRGLKCKNWHGVSQYLWWVLYLKKKTTDKK